MKEYYHTLKSKVWGTYHSLDPKAFVEKIEELETWAKATLPDGTGLDAVLKLCAKTPRFLLAYEYPSAHRTSNPVLSVAEGMVDRHISNSRYETKNGTRMTQACSVVELSNGYFDYAHLRQVYTDFMCFIAFISTQKEGHTMLIRFNPP